MIIIISNRLLSIIYIPSVHFIYIRPILQIRKLSAELNNFPKVIEQVSWGTKSEPS